MTEYSTTTHVTTDGGFVEFGTIRRNGREYSAQGAMIHHDRAVGYFHAGAGAGEGAGAKGTIRAWGGKVMGDAWIVSSWPIRSYVASRMYAIHALIGGHLYHGRGCGSGMLWRGKRVKRAK